MRLVFVTAVVCALYALQLELVACQDSCVSSSGPIGFTALTPDQLKEEIRQGIVESLPEGATYADILEVVLDDAQLLSDQAIADLKESLETFIDVRLKEAVEELTTAFKDELSAINVTLSPSEVVSSPVTTETAPKATTPATTPPPPTVLPPGLSPLNPATSCLEVQQSVGNAPSANYWVADASNGNAPISVYCDMTRSCGDLTGGWMRAVLVNMTDPTHQCPDSYVELVRPTPPTRLCTPDSDNGGCFAHTFPVSGPKYTHVCGRVIGYQDRTPNGFYPFQVAPSLGIDDLYVEGIVLTHGNPRAHIWTFVGALDEETGHLSACECSNDLMSTAPNIPSFVGGDYFCDTGTRTTPGNEFYSNDPLWDGQGCGPRSSCCSLNSPPWFYKQLTSATDDGLEMRVCRDSGVTNENTPFELVELYVR